MSVIPAIYNFQDHYRGSTFAAVPITFNFDITGAELICQIKQNPTSPNVHQWKTGVNITVVDALIGKIILDKIAEFKPNAGLYMHDFQIKFADYTIETYLKGELKVLQDVTAKIV